MRVKINGRTDIHTFSLYDEALGYDLIFEFLETNCTFVAEKFIYHEAEDIYICEADDFDKWQLLIDEQQQLSKRINQLKLEYGEEDVEAAVNRAIFHSIEDEAKAINYELDRAFGESTIDDEE
jgi:hypothetical protein